MNKVAEYNPLLQYLHSSNELGDIYHIPYGIVDIREDIIMKTFIGCRINYKPKHIEVVVIHRGALRYGTLTS